VRGIEADIPRTLTKRSDVLPLPGGEGGVRGKALFDFSIAFSILQVALIAPKIAKNLPVFELSFVTNDLQNEFLRRGNRVWPRWKESLIGEDPGVLESVSLSLGERVGVRASLLRN